MIQDILAERGNNYGKFVDHARISQELVSVMRKEPGWSKLESDQKEALEMVMHKVARIINGKPDYLDSWVDIVGYTQLVVDRLNGNAH